MRKGLSSFLDRFFKKEMAAAHIPGAVISVVKDGKILFARGYGYANLARRARVSPDRTLFRLCSVSKVVTATAVMQLVEQGKLGLHADVNRYLTLFKLPETFRQPVTVANLLTHTGGFDELHIGRSTLNPSALRPLGRYLAARMPARVLPPGEVYSYSDHGYALAGYLVQAVSGVPFARYVHQHMFRPLGMQHSSFQQPLPANLAADMATGYDVSGGKPPRAAPFEYFNTAPAAAMVSTATDMAHLMIAQLQAGRYGTKRILRPATVREMQRQQFSSYPRLPGVPPLPGVAYGFGIYYQNGQRILDHSGALRGFSSLLTLLPAHRLGFFVAANTANDAYLGDLQRALINHYFSAKRSATAAPRPWEGAHNPISRFAGSYWSTEYSRRTIEKVRQLLNQVQVTITGKTSLTAHFWNGSTVRLIRVAPLLFQTTGSGAPSYWAFQQDASGRITHLVPGGNEVYDKIGWYEATNVQLGFIGAFILIFLSGCLAWLIVPLIGRLYRVIRASSGGSSTPEAVVTDGRLQGVTDERHTDSARPLPYLWWTEKGSRSCEDERTLLHPWWSRVATIGRWLAGVTSVLNLFFLVTFLLLMESAASTQNLHYSWIEYGVPPSVVALLCVPLATTLLAVVMPIFTVPALADSSSSLFGRLHRTAITLAALAFIPFLLYWNLLGFHF